MKSLGAFILLFLVSVLSQAQPISEPVKWLWISAAYGTPVITNSTFNQNGLLEIKAGGRITHTNITLVGGLENTLTSGDTVVPERFSLFFGPGFIFKDKLMFFSIHTGLSYPFYKNAPDYPKNPGLHSSIDIGVRIGSRFTVGLGLSNHLASDINAYNLRFWVQLNSD